MSPEPGGVVPGPERDGGPPPAIELRPGPPALVLALAAPLAALALVGARAATSGLSSGPDDPVPPWAVAVVTVLLGAGVGWRALTQRAVLHPDRLACRNVLSSYEVPWDRVSVLERRDRLGLVTVEVEVSGLRRGLRLGPATRTAGDDADAVADVLRAHPVAGGLLVDDAP